MGVLTGIFKVDDGNKGTGTAEEVDDDNEDEDGMKEDDDGDEAEEDDETPAATRDMVSEDGEETVDEI